MTVRTIGLLTSLIASVLSAPAAFWNLLLSSAAIWASGLTVEDAHSRMLSVAASTPRGLHSAPAAFWKPTVVFCCYLGLRDDS